MLFDSHQPPMPTLGTVTRARGAPDIECTGIMLMPMPLVEAGFERDFVIVKIMITAVGPPGWSSAPYMGQKKIPKSELRPLYDVDESGNTVMYSFKKVSNNKNKGDRVSEAQTDDGETVTVKAPLVAGTVLKFFLRQDKCVNVMGQDGILVGKGSGDASPFIALDKYPVHKTRLEVGECVVINVRSKNAEQAVKGNMLNVTKLSMPPRTHFRHGLFARMPRSAAEYENIAADVMTQRCLRECVEMENKTCYTLDLDSNWFLNSSGFEETHQFILTDGSQNAFVLPWCVICELFNCGEPKECYKVVRKVLDMMLARDCVRITVKLSSFKGNIYNDDDAVVLHMCVDEERFLEVEALRQVRDGRPLMGTGVRASVAVEGGVTWLGAELRDRPIVMNSGERHMIVCAKLEADEGDDKWWEHRQSTIGCPPVEAAISFVQPPGKSFKMLLGTLKKQEFDVSAHFEGPERAREADAVTMHATVWWQPQCGGGGGSLMSTSRKRVREGMSSEEEM